MDSARVKVSKLKRLLDMRVDVACETSPEFSGILIFGTKAGENIKPVAVDDRRYHGDSSTGWYVVREDERYAERIFKNDLCRVDVSLQTIELDSDLPSGWIEREESRIGYGICNGGVEWQR